MFHAMLLERRHYRALGWRLPYDFSVADFTAAVKQVVHIHSELMMAGEGGAGGAGMGLTQALQAFETIESDAVDRSLPGLLYVAGQCLYGGKV